MSRYQPPTPTRIAALIKQGRGQIGSSDYRPWFEAPSIPSRGRLVRTISVTTGRVMQMVSELEASIQLLGDFDQTLDEQYEQVLLNLQLTYDIARRLRVRHIRARQGRHLVPMTTDLVFGFRNDPHARQVAVSVKYQSEIDGRRGRRTRGQLAIEEMYHLVQGRRFVVATDADAPPVTMSNLRWLREGMRRGSAQITDRAQADFETAFPRQVSLNKSIGERIARASKVCGLRFEDGVDAFRRAVWHRRIQPDLNFWLRLDQPFVPARDFNLGVKLPWVH